LTRSTASQASKSDARPNRNPWPRVGAKIEGRTIIVRVLGEDERADAPGVLYAEPDERFRTVEEAAAQAVSVLVARLRKHAALPVVAG